jgi:hypothetical protein
MTIGHILSIVLLIVIMLDDVLPTVFCAQRCDAVYGLRALDAHVMPHCTRHILLRTEAMGVLTPFFNHEIMGVWAQLYAPSQPSF